MLGHGTENCIRVQQEAMSQHAGSTTQHLHISDQKHLFKYF